MPTDFPPEIVALFDTLALRPDLLGVVANGGAA